MLTVLTGDSMKPEVLATITVSIILLVGGFIYFASDPAPSAEADNTKEVSTNAVIELSEVEKHNSENDCWTVIDGSVYDVTAFIADHPGGDNILSACGIDATEYFSGERTGQEGDSNDHSSNSTALSQLSDLKIGTLSN